MCCIISHWTQQSVFKWHTQNKVVTLHIYKLFYTLKTSLQCYPLASMSIGIIAGVEVN